MGKVNIDPIYKKRAAISIFQIGLYIEAKGYPITANRFVDKLYEFGNSLGEYPDKFPVCRKKEWAMRNLRCAIFKNDYIFVYKLIDDVLVIYNVVHARTIS